MIIWPDHDANDASKLEDYSQGLEKHREECCPEE
jgi:hypothetical protein